MEFLYPIFERHDDGETAWHVVRPFYNAQSGPGDRYQVQFLWPLGLYFRRADQETRFRLFPFWHYQRTWSDRAGGYSTHAHLLQLLRWGNTAEHGPYLALFPLGGVTHNVLGPTWSFALFPLYSYFRRDDYVRHDVLWPVFTYGRAPQDRVVRYRFWPFYVYQRKSSGEALYVRRDVLWPLARWGRLDMGGDYHHTVKVLVPFYASIRTYDRDDNLVAHRFAVLGMRRAWDSRETKETVGWGALWNIVNVAHETLSDTFRIFPFYWRTVHYRTPEKEPDRSWVRHRILWPIIWVDHDRLEPGVRKRGLVVAPFYWDYSERYPSEDGPTRTGRRITLWPLATWESESDGAKHFWIGSRGWRDPTGGYKRNYRAFLDFVQHHRTADGTRETRVLSRLYHHRRGPSGRYLSLASLFTYDSMDDVVGQDGSYVSVLFGLLKCSWTDTRRRWRVLYIPFGDRLTEPQHG
ncbi:MAG: hypothetical protein R6V05_11780 [Candidatus Brocadiia bacterium]